MDPGGELTWSQPMINMMIIIMVISDHNAIDSDDNEENVTDNDDTKNYNTGWRG